MIDPARVEEILKDSLAGSAADADVKAEGLVAAYGFSRAKLEAHRHEVVGMLAQLNENFFDDGGGGWSFLQIVQTADGELWTGLHRTAEQLVCLGIGLGLISYLMPRDMWVALPGGVPYLVVARTKFGQPVAA